MYSRLRQAAVVLIAVAVFLGVAETSGGCGNDPDSVFDASTDESAQSDATTPPPFSTGGDGGGSRDGSSDDDASGDLVVTPATVTLQVVLANGVVTVRPTQQFTATYQGAPVAAQWLFDRGELGAVAASGIFTPSGGAVGEGVVTARFGAREGSAKVKVTLSAAQNGAPAGADAGADGGLGGLGGVGGEPLGGPVPVTLLQRFRVESNLPVTPQELGFQYPYDRTVWPRGLLPPLMMWDTTHEAAAVYVKLSQGNYTFEGAYAYDAQPPGGVQRKRVRLEEVPWRVATNGNTGDALVAEVKIYSAADDKVYGPIKQTWRVAPGVLKGTVYYNSYDSRVTSGGGAELGGVIAIKPRSPEPALAVPSMAGKCHVCHTLSADGSRLFAQDGKVDFVNGGDDYRNGASYDLTNNGARTDYKATGAGGVAANDRKFVWSAPYPDGSFALVSSRFAREAYTQGDAKLFETSAAATEVPATGLDAVQSAVTPAFSPDGRKVVFNFWEGLGAGGVAAGAGRSLAIMDFACGAAAGSVKCAAGTTPAFTNLRQVYNDGARYPGWPAFVPDGKAVVFHNTVNPGQCGPNPPDRASIYNCHLTTWYDAQAELWYVRDAAGQVARRLDDANGIGPGGTSYLPTNGVHPDDTRLNYQPTVNPVASGGYYWVVFTSRRMYGNVATGDPFNGSPDPKKLWVAAIDINAPAGTDPSHPAFYLPGQELGAGNSRGFWVVDPCKPNGTTCETGDECCNGFCRSADGGLVCQDKPPGVQCAQEFEKCTVDADCCNPSFKCLNGRCARPDPVVK